MAVQITRRAAMGRPRLARSAYASAPLALAQAKPKLRFFLRLHRNRPAYRGPTRALARGDEGRLRVRGPSGGNTMFKQGTEAGGRCSARISSSANLAPGRYLGSRSRPWSLMNLGLSVPRLRPPETRTFKSEVGQDFVKLGPRPARHRADPPGSISGARPRSNLKPSKKINTPGRPCRAPSCACRRASSGSFLGEIDRRQTRRPVAYAELYTALQTGTVDGQDNPLVAARTMKFYEVTTQFVLTNHGDRLRHAGGSRRRPGKRLAPTSRPSCGPRPTRPSTRTRRSTTRRKKEAIEFFKKEGKQVYTPRPERLPHLRPENAYLDKYASEWPKGRDREDQRHQVGRRHR